MVLIDEKITQRYRVTKDELMSNLELRNCSFRYGNQFDSYFLKDGEPFLEGYNTATRKKWDFFKKDELYEAILTIKKEY